jgi:hypothetical protein
MLIFKFLDRGGKTILNRMVANITFVQSTSSGELLLWTLATILSFI